MKLVTLVLLMVGVATARDFETKARVLSAEDRQIGTVILTGNRGFSTTRMETTELQIDSLIYLSNDTCKHARVGETYPAHVEKRHIYLQVGDKTCKYWLIGKKEIQ